MLAIQDIKAPYQLERIFLKSYGSTLDSLSDSVISEDLDINGFLIACVLLVCTELVRNEAANASLHLDGACNFLAKHHEKAQDVDAELMRTLRQLCVHCSSYLTTWRSPFDFNEDQKNDKVPRQSIFDSPASAAKALTSIMYECFEFIGRGSNRKYRPRTQSSENLLNEQSRLLEKIDTWIQNLAQSVLDSRTIINASFSPESAKILTANAHSTYIYLGAILQPLETEYDAHTSRFAAIVDSAQSILCPSSPQEDELERQQSKSFTPELGLIQPLYFTATRCRVPGLRRRATDMLFQTGYEGPWKGPSMGVVARQVIADEEKLMTKMRIESQTPLDNVPDLFREMGRFHSIGLDSNSQKGKIEVYYRYLSHEAIAEFRRQRTMQDLIEKLHALGGGEHIHDDVIDLTEEKWWLRGRSKILNLPELVGKQALPVFQIYLPDDEIADKPPLLVNSELDFDMGLGMLPNSGDVPFDVERYKIV